MKYPIRRSRLVPIWVVLATMYFQANYAWENEIQDGNLQGNDYDYWKFEKRGESDSHGAFDKGRRYLKKSGKGKGSGSYSTKKSKSSKKSSKSQKSTKQASYSRSRSGKIFHVLFAPQFHVGC